ncbi:unnamed protein product, partial [Ectocarpus sp. 12 AP-2014]
MNLDTRARADLRTFRRTMGAILLIPSADAIMDVASRDAAPRDTREGQPAAGSEVDLGPADSRAEACIAETWAAAAIGAQFDGRQPPVGERYIG